MAFSNRPDLAERLGHSVNGVDQRLAVLESRLQTQLETERLEQELEKVVKIRAAYEEHADLVLTQILGGNDPANSPDWALLANSTNAWYLGEKDPATSLFAKQGDTVQLAAVRSLLYTDPDIDPSAQADASNLLNRREAQEARKVLRFVTASALVEKVRELSHPDISDAHRAAYMERIMAAQKMDASWTPAKAISTARNIHVELQAAGVRGRIAETMETSENGPRTIPSLFEQKPGDVWQILDEDGTVQWIPAVDKPVTIVTGAQDIPFRLIETGAIVIEHWVIDEETQSVWGICKNACEGNLVRIRLKRPEEWEPPTDPGVSPVPEDPPVPKIRPAVKPRDLDVSSEDEVLDSVDWSDALGSAPPEAVDSESSDLSGNDPFGSIDWGELPPPSDDDLDLSEWSPADSQSSDDFSAYEIPDPEDIPEIFPLRSESMGDIETYDERREGLKPLVSKLVEKYAPSYNITDKEEFAAFLMAMIHVESKFDPNAQRRASGKGEGLVQMRWRQYTTLEVQALRQYDYSHAMGLQGSSRPSVFGPDWIDPSKVTRMDDILDAEQHLERFITGFAGPAFRGLEVKYPDKTAAQIWDGVAYSWEEGVTNSLYDSDGLPKASEYVSAFQTWFARYRMELNLGDFPYPLLIKDAPGHSSIRPDWTDEMEQIVDEVYRVPALHSPRFIVWPGLDEETFQYFGEMYLVLKPDDTVDEVKARLEKHKDEF